MYTNRSTILCYAVHLFKVLAELVVDEGVSHVLESHRSVPQQSTLRVMLRVVPGQLKISFPTHTLTYSTHTA